MGGCPAVSSEYATGLQVNRGASGGAPSLGWTHRGRNRASPRTDDLPAGQGPFGARDRLRHTSAVPTSERLRGLLAEGGAAYKAGRFDETERLFSLALAEAETDDADPALLRECLFHLAGFYRMRGRLGAAESAYARLLAVEESLVGPEAPGIATILNTLGELQRT